MGPDQTLRYAQDLANLRGEGRALRRRIEADLSLPTVVVLADDDPMMRALLANTLSPETYYLREASTGDEALADAYAYHPILMILDQQMPGLSGVEVCAKIKSDRQLTTTAVLMLTGDPADEPAARAAGADAYLSKPFSPRELLDMVEAVFAGR
jgi:two-component system, OmpR family, phosphate regulon response regulator PhoB